MAKAGNTTQASERRILRKYLARYYIAKDKREILQGRLSLLRKDLPGKGGFMPPLSVPEIEVRHIDCKNWAEICDTVYLTRTPCAKYYNRGLDALLRMSKVRRTLGLEERAGG